MDDTGSFIPNFAQEEPTPQTESSRPFQRNFPGPSRVLSSTGVLPRCPPGGWAAFSHRLYMNDGPIDAPAPLPKPVWLSLKIPCCSKHKSREMSFLLSQLPPLPFPCSPFLRFHWFAPAPSQTHPHRSARSQSLRPPLLCSQGGISNLQRAWPYFRDSC